MAQGALGWGCGCGVPALLAGSSHPPALRPNTLPIPVADVFVPLSRSFSAWTPLFLTLDLGNTEMVHDGQRLVHFGGYTG